MVEEDSTAGKILQHMAHRMMYDKIDGKFTRLHLEEGVYNFYLQDEKYKWEKYCLDSGAAAIVFPVDKEANAVSKEDGEETREETKEQGP